MPPFSALACIYSRVLGPRVTANLAFLSLFLPSDWNTNEGLVTTASWYEGHGARKAVTGGNFPRKTL